MSDPKRWLDSVDELGDAERRALVAGRDVAPPADFGSEAWAALALKLPPPGSLPPAGGATATGGAASVASGAGLVAVVKAATVGALFGAAVLTGRSMMTPADTTQPRAIVAAAPAPVAAPAQERPAEPMPTATQPDLETSTAAPAPRAKVVEPTPPSGEPRERAPAVEPAIPRAPEPAVVVPPRAPSSEVAPDPREESRVIAAARDALRSGRFTSALATLEEARLRYPNGILGQEREALTIEALVAADRRDEAEKRAAAFLHDHPESPHAARVRAVLRW
jgi:hypothetical protein